MATLKTKLLLRNDTTANWTTYQEMVLSKGEAGVEWYVGTGDTNKNGTADSGETAASPKLKIGDGLTAWKDLPYIQQGIISTTIGTSGSGNTVVGASVTYTNGVYSITLTKANRVVDITATDDDVVILTRTQNWSTGHTIDAKHATQGPSTTANTTSTSNANVSIDPKVGGKLSVPQITVNKYGHTTAITNQEVAVAGHDITVTNDGNTSGNTIISISKGDNHEVKYTKGNRLTGSGLTADTILLGNGGYAVKTSSKKLESTLTNDDTKVPTSKAVYTEIQEVLKIANAAMTLVGTLGDSASGATHTSLNTASEEQLGDAYKVIKAGTYGGITAKAGDLIVCYKPTSTTYAWILIPAGDDIEDSWRAVQLDGTQKLSTSTSSGALNLKNVTAKSVSVAYNGGFEFDVKTGYTTSGKNYAVAKDSNGNLYVNVPWTDTTNSYTASAGIKIVNNDIQHTNSVTAGTASGESGTTAKALGSTVSLPSVTYDAQGHITAKGTTSFVLPDAAAVQGAVKGYGQITVGVNSSAVTNPANYTTAVTLAAVGHNEKVTISPSNKWIRLNATNSSTGGSDTMTIGHITSGVTANTYGQSAAKTLKWIEGNADTFTVVKPTVDAAGHITAISNITVTIPNDLVTTSLRGLVPKAVANSFLVTKNGGTAASWEKVLVLDGGSANTSDWGTIS